ncbi:hypothetical protein HPB52_012806 [Rhipicephalus sanguineus]|uniref:Uncharacterized protein n=1 Tax=Rhipicephalus sanguineus TaxID=34632 RepID=A0A9D4PYN8_RHISA|nr:hypothetical protein HPB52_012806 [Rhipicephalus sanguineus]
MNAADLDTARTSAPILPTKSVGAAAPRIQSKTMIAKQNANYVEKTTRRGINVAKPGIGFHTSSNDEDGNVPGERNRVRSRSRSSNRSRSRSTTRSVKPTKPPQATDNSKGTTGNQNTGPPLQEYRPL